MTEFRELFLPYEEKRGRSGVSLRLVLLALAGMIFQASGQTPGGWGSDWASLMPPPASAADTNSSQTNCDFSYGLDAVPGVAINSLEMTNYISQLAMAGYYNKTLEPQMAESTLVGLLAANVPEAVQKAALLRLGEVVRNENDLVRAQTIYAQFLTRWPDDWRVPEVFLRQGEIFRQMGLTDLALTKFYSVMAAALTLKNNQFGYYQKLVLETQVQIADTHYLMGQFVDAADFYKRLLDNPDPSLDRPQIQFRLVRSLTIIGRNAEAVSEGQDFVSRYPDADETPEVRYYLAQALKAMGRGDEALQQVLLCLEQQKTRAGNDPTVWRYWQQRVGNEIGNQLYHEGDYVHALEIYVDLAQLDSSATWQVPVDYQMGLTYEKLLQPEKAVDTYQKIVALEPDAGTNASPGMQAIFGMAQWRINFLQWEQGAQTADQSIADAAASMHMPTNSTNKITQ